SDVAGGRYDPTIRDIAGVVREVAPSPVYLRFGHEMELTGLYPWARGDPAGYIAMYRHFVQTVRDAHTDNARFVWSPAGSPDAHSSFPGDPFGDMGGRTILQSIRYGPSQPFQERLQERYDALGSLGKPIMVSELGIDLATEQAETDWLAEARRSFTSFP